MRISIYALILCFLFPTTLVLGQTTPSVTDTIELNFDTVALPKRGPNFLNYYGSGQKLFATTPVYYNGIKVYESNDFGTSWHVKFDKVVDFDAHDSAVIYCQYVHRGPISANVFTGSDGAYKIFVSNDGGNSFHMKDSNYVQSFGASRFSCADDYIKLQRLNDSVLIYGINKHCNIYHPTGLYGFPFARISINNGRTWFGTNYQSMPDFTINGTAFRRRDSFLLFTQRADFQYIDSLKLLPELIETVNNESSGRSFVGGVFSFIFTNRYFNHSIIYSTRNKGQTWQIDTLGVQLQPESKNQIIQVKDTVFLMGKYGLNRADNGNFQNLKRIYPQFNNNNTRDFSFSIVSSGIYINGVDKALFRSKNGGNTWEMRNNTEGSVGDGGLSIFGEDVWFYDKKWTATYHFEGENPVSRLDTFAQVIPNFPFRMKGFRKDSLYLIGGRDRQIRSFDKGFTWKNLPVEQFNTKSDSNRIYGVGRYNSVVVSADNGNNFSRFFMPDSTENLVDVIIKKHLVWATVGNSVIRSTDSGQTWATVFKRADIVPGRLVMEGQTLWMHASSRQNFTGGQVFKSTDDGITWTQLSSDVSRVCDDMIRKNGYLFLYGESSGRYWFFISKNDGITWTKVNNAPNVLITDKYIYTSTSPAFFQDSTLFKISRFPIDSLANKLKSAKIYSLLRGQILKDKNTNCRQDTTDVPFTSKMLRFNGNFNTSTDQNGRFSIMLPVDTYKIEVVNERYYALRCGSDTATKRLIIQPNQATDTTLFFQKTKSVRDIAVVLTANGRPRPVNELEFVAHLKNLGTETVDSLRLQFDFSNMPVRLVSAAPNTVQNGQKLTWTRRNFAADAEELLKISVRIDTTTPLSTSLNFYAQADILGQTDTFPSDNRDSARLTVVGSYDPNDKTAMPEGRVPLAESPKVFDYLIRFQNTGTDTAYRVMVLDALPELLDMHTLSVKSASHPYQLTVDKNVVTFTFDRIMLPDSFVNERASHGFIRFTINPKKRLSAGETVYNNANIFFDFNTSILTNTAQTDVYKPVIQTQKTVVLCAGDTWQGIVYTRSTVLVDTIVKPFVDTIRTTFLDVKPTYYRQIDTTLRYGDTLFGQRMDVSQRIIVGRRTVFGCDSTTVYNVVVVRPNSTADLGLSEIKITLSPNPVNNWLSINYRLDKDIETEIYWVNTLGQKMGILKKKSLDTEGVHALQLDMRGVARGIYQVIFQTAKGGKTVVFSKI